MDLTITSALYFKILSGWYSKCSWTYLTVQSGLLPQIPCFHAEPTPHLLSMERSSKMAPEWVSLALGGAVFLQTGAEGKLRRQIPQPSRSPSFPPLLQPECHCFHLSGQLQFLKNNIFPSQWLDACISLLAPAFCGLLGRIANFPKAFEWNEFKESCLFKWFLW